MMDDIRELLLEAAKEIMAVYKGEKLGASMPEMAHRLEDAAESLGEPFAWVTPTGRFALAHEGMPPEGWNNTIALYLAPPAAGSVPVEPMEATIDAGQIKDCPNWAEYQGDRSREHEYKEMAERIYHGILAAKEQGHE